MATIANIFSLKLDNSDFNAQIEKATKLSQERSDLMAASLLKSSQLEEKRILLLQKRATAQAEGDKASITELNKQISATASLITVENRRIAVLNQADAYLKKHVQSLNEVTVAAEKASKAEIDETKRRNEVLSSLSAQRISEEKQRYATISALNAQKSKEAADVEIANAKRRNEVLSSLSAQRISEEKRVADLKTGFSQAYESTPAQNKYNEALGKLNSLRAEGIITQDQYSKALAKENDILKAGEPLRDSQFNHMIRVMRWAGTLIGAYYALNAAYDATIGKGTQVAAQFESMEIGISALVAANSKNETSLGRHITASEKFAMAQNDAADAVIQLRKANIDTPATLVQLTQGFQSALGPAMALGFSIKQTVEYSRLMTLAAASMKVPMEQLSQEMRSILNGTIDQNSIVANALGLTNSQIKAHEKLGDTYEFLISKLSDFNAAGSAVNQSWDGVVSNMSDAWGAFTADFVKSTGIFDALKSSMKGITALLNNQNGELDKLKSYIPVVEGLATTFAVLYAAKKAAGAYELILDAIRTKSTVTTSVYNAALMREVETTVTLTASKTALTFASQALTVAMRAIPAIAVASAVAYLATEFFEASRRSDDLGDSLNATADALGKLSKAQLEYKRTNLSLELQDVGLELRRLKQSAGPTGSRSTEDQKKIDDLTDSYNQLRDAAVKVADAQKGITRATTDAGKATAKATETLVSNPKVKTPEEIAKEQREAERAANKAAELAKKSLNDKLASIRLSEQQYFVDNDINDALAQKSYHQTITLENERKATVARRDAFKTQDEYDTAVKNAEAEILKIGGEITQGIKTRTREYDKQQLTLKDQISAIGTFSDEAKINMSYEATRNDLAEKYKNLLSDNEQLGERGLGLRKELLDTLTLELDKTQKISDEAKKQLGLKLDEAIYQENVSLAKQLDTYTSLTDQQQKSLDIERERESAYHAQELALRSAGLLEKNYTDMTEYEKKQADYINQVLSDRLLILDKASQANSVFYKTVDTGINKLSENISGFFDYQSEQWIKTGNLAKGVLDSIYREMLKLMVLDPIKAWMGGGASSAASMFASMYGSGSALSGATTDSAGFTTTVGGTVFDSAGKITLGGSDATEVLSSLSNVKSLYSLATNGLTGMIYAPSAYMGQLAGTAYGAGFTGTGSFLGGVSNAFAGGNASGLSGAGFAGNVLGAGAMGAVGGYALGSLGDKLFGADTKAGTYGAIGGAIGATVGSIVPVVGTLIGGAIGSALGSVIGGMFGSTKFKGFKLGEDTSGDTSSISQWYQKKSWFDTSNKYKGLTTAQADAISGVFATYDYLLTQLGSVDDIVVKAGRYSSSGLFEAIDKAFIRAYVDDPSLTDTFYTAWTAYAKQLGKGVSETFTTLISEYVGTTREFELWALEGAGNSMEALRLQAEWAMNDFKAIEKLTGTSGVTVQNYLEKYDEALKSSFTPETITAWESLGEALMVATDAQVKYAETIKSTVKSTANANISLLQSIFDTLNSTIDKLRGAAGGATYNINQFRQAMNTAMSLKNSPDYTAFTNAVKSAADYSSVLLDANNFQTARDMRFAQAVAANQFEDLGKSALTQIDYLRIIAENTANLTTVSVVTTPSSSFAVGTTSVPRDMTARIHKDEIIVPKNFSDGVRNGDLMIGATDNSALIEAVNRNTSATNAIITILNDSRDIQNASLIQLDYIGRVS